MLSLFVATNKRKWLILVALGALVGLGLAGTLWAVSLWNQTMAVEETWSRVRGAVVAGGDPASWEGDLASLERKAEVLRRRVDSLGRWRTVPLLGRELGSVWDMATVNAQEAASARHLLQGLSLLRGLAQEGSWDPGQARLAAEAFERAEAGQVVSLGPPPRLPPLRKRYDVLKEASGQVEMLTRWGDESASLVLAVGEVDRTLQEGDWSFTHLEETLRTVNGRAAAVQGLTPGVRDAFPTLGQELDRLSDLLDGLGLVAGGASQGLTALRPALAILEQEQPSLLHSGAALARVLAILQEGRPALEEAAAQVEKGIAQLSSAPPDTLQRLGELKEAFQAIAALSQVAPSLLGLEGSRKYLVLGQTADELRATGGFISTIWVVTFQKGELMEIRYKDTVEVDDLDHLDLYPVPPLGLERHMQACCWLLRDVSWEPDFPFSARLAQEVYQLGQSEAVNGVIALNQWTLQRLVDLVGGLPTPEGDGRISPEGFMTFLQEKTDAEGRGYTRYVLPQLLLEMEKRVAPSQVVDLAK
ncbi:MAG: DUF4012 domain-containing protein, partial [Chloroflexi bacterium]|nr:DUF4012 domain-containing protein [Chloroflexota bacterium]